MLCGIAVASSHRQKVPEETLLPTPWRAARRTRVRLLALPARVGRSMLFCLLLSACLVVCQAGFPSTPPLSVLLVCDPRAKKRQRSDVPESAALETSDTLLAPHLTRVPAHPPSQRMRMRQKVEEWQESLWRLVQREVAERRSIHGSNNKSPHASPC